MYIVEIRRRVVGQVNIAFRFIGNIKTERRLYARKEKISKINHERFLRSILWANVSFIKEFSEGYNFFNFSFLFLPTH